MRISLVWNRFVRRITRDSSCVAFVESVTDYLEGALPSRERARFERHLRVCDGCERYLAQIRRTIDLSGRLTVADVDALPSDGRERLLAAFRAFQHDHGEP